MESRSKLEDIESYAYAACQSCAWKLSKHGTGADGAQVAEAADDHAKEAGHRVLVIETRHIEFDYRVERGS